MARLADKAIEEMVALYRADDAATIAQVAEAYGASPVTAKKHLEAAGVILRPEFGASDEPEPATDPASSVDMASPEFKGAVAQAVAEALKNLGAPAAASPASDWAEFMANMKQFAQAIQTQQPGYTKPLSPEQITEREAGKAEFFRLLKEAADAVEEYGRRGARERDLVPEYVVGPNGFYMKTDNGEQLFSPGQPLFLTIAPPADFEPLNEAAGRIMAAQLQWLGEGVPDVGELVSRANMRALGHDPDKGDRDTERRNRVVAEVDGDREESRVGPRRIMGTTVEETGNDGHSQFRLTKGHVGRPLSGPVFGEAA